MGREHEPEALSMIKPKEVPPKSQRMWTADEDEKLRAGVKEHGFHWKLISRSLLPHRDAASCHQRWRDSLDPDIKSGPWSAAVRAPVASFPSDRLIRSSVPLRRMPS